MTNRIQWKGQAGALRNWPAASWNAPWGKASCHVRHPPPPSCHALGSPGQPQERPRGGGGSNPAPSCPSFPSLGAIRPLRHPDSSHIRSIVVTDVSPVEQTQHWKPNKRSLLHTMKCCWFVASTADQESLHRCASLPMARHLAVTWCPASPDAQLGKRTRVERGGGRSGEGDTSGGGGLGQPTCTDTQ